MSRWVQRDKDTGEVTGHFANPQPGYAEEELPDDHPELKAFHKRRELARLAVSPHKALEERITELERALAELRAKVG